MIRHMEHLCNELMHIFKFKSRTVAKSVHGSGRIQCQLQQLDNPPYIHSHFSSHAIVNMSDFDPIQFYLLWIYSVILL